MRARLSCQQNNTCSNVVVTDQLRSARRGWESGALPPSPHYGRIGSPASSASWCVLKTNGAGIAACTAIAFLKANRLRNKGWRVGKRNRNTASVSQRCAIPMYVPLCAPPYPTRTKTASFRLVSFVLRRAILARSNHWSLPTIALEVSLVDEEEE